MMGSLLLLHVLPVVLCWVPSLLVRYGGLNYFQGMRSKDISHGIHMQASKQSDVLRGRSVRRTEVPNSSTSYGS